MAKVLHELAGKAIVSHVLDAADALRPERAVVVVGRDSERVRAVVGDRAACVLQAEQLGSGHAALQARKALAGFTGDVLLLCGDVPLLEAATLENLLSSHRSSGALATVLGMTLDDPTGYGRILDDGGGSVRIVEHVDATPEQRAVRVANTGTYCFDAEFLFRALGRLGRDNAQGEYYLTDLLEAASRDGRARAVVLDDASEGLGINSRLDLARAEAALQERLVRRWLDRGVTFLDPTSVYLSAAARIGRDTIVGPTVRIDGATAIGEGCTLDGACHLRDTIVEDGAWVRWGVVADGARIGPGARVGPYAHLRPQADLGPDVHIGNFVEVKKARLGRGSKANHLAYIGDATIGADVNVGAGTITCNYDGFAKHATVIGDRVQIGSDTQLVAPVTLGNDVYVAAGSTVTKDVEAGALVFNVKPQQVRAGWTAQFRRKSAARKQSSREHDAGAAAAAPELRNGTAKAARSGRGTRSHAKAPAKEKR
jgi:bifunctional UDP-N-acetylglucosamine pyrophosphorylase/glucosamine-1-phosphate N-acetyltransferase